MHDSLIHNTVFQKTQDNAIYFSSDESISSYRTHCYFKDNFIPNPKSGTLIIKNKEANSADFSGNQNHRPYFVLKNGYTCGYIKIVGCVLKKCFSVTDGGGGIFISQHENVFIHETLFDTCYTTCHGGAGGCICGLKFQNEEMHDEQLPRAEIQYCCFQNCYGAYDYTMGTALYIAAVNLIMNYTSTTNCSCIIRSRGAQFDIQSQRPTLENMNITGGISFYCGMIEYRYSIEGYYKFQTMINISSKYGSAFAYSEMNKLSVTHCNYISNIIVEQYQGDLSTLVYLAHHHINIENFYFIKNNFIHNYGQFVARVWGGTVTVNMINCYFDEKNQERYDKTFVTYNNCFLGTKSFTQCFLIHVSLGICVGSKTAEPLLLSNTFSPSHYFTPSSHFTNSLTFSKSFYFSNSHLFSDSTVFTISDIFSNTEYFTCSNLFSKSSYFYPSIIFTNSQKFSNSEHFSLSQSFTKSKLFTKSDLFTSSKLFSKSNMFSTSFLFTNSETFSNSEHFSLSQSFTKSKSFTKSDLFTSSKLFSNSYIFSTSFLFTNSEIFSKSEPFSYSITFSNSNHFSLSSNFSRSLIFTSNHEVPFLPHSSIYSYSKVFSFYNGFTESFLFTLSNIFFETYILDQTMKFSESTIFPFLSTHKTNKKMPIFIICIIPIVAIVLILIILFIIYIFCKNKEKSTEEDEMSQITKANLMELEKTDSRKINSNDEDDRDLGFWL